MEEKWWEFGLDLQIVRYLQTVVNCEQAQICSCNNCGVKLSHWLEKNSSVEDEASLGSEKCQFLDVCVAVVSQLPEGIGT